MKETGSAMFVAILVHLFFANLLNFIQKFKYIFTYQAIFFYSE